MPKVLKAILLEQFETAVLQGGWSAIRLATDAEGAQRYRLVRSGETLDLRLYLRTVTPGGNTRPKGEWRIQPTGCGGSFKVSPGMHTLVMGWEPGRDVFAGFDVQAHLGPLGGSPSIQINEAALDGALITGLSPHEKASKEVVFGITPALVGVYVAQAPLLHQTGAVASDLHLLNQVVSTPDLVTPDDIATHASVQRRQLLQTILRTVRDSRFRARVLNAYDHTCGFCGVQLDLLDAAHILPVSESKSTDEINNGVAMCALHHRAYDRGLIAFDTTLGIHTSAVRIADLVAKSLGGGAGEFAKGLLPNLLAPSAALKRPKSSLVKIANIHRGWSLG